MHKMLPLYAKEKKTFIIWLGTVWNPPQGPLGVPEIHFEKQYTKFSSADRRLFVTAGGWFVCCLLFPSRLTREHTRSHARTQMLMQRTLTRTPAHHAARTTFSCIIHDNKAAFSIPRRAGT